MLTIPKEIKDMWTSLKSHGDSKILVERAKEIGLDISDETINRAHRTGRCSEDVFRLMGEFYKEREELINQFRPAKVETISE